MPRVVVAISFFGDLPPAPERVSLPEGRPRECVWQGLDDPSEFLVLLGFSSEAAAGEDLRRLVEADEAEEAEGPLPSAVSHVALEHERGTVLDDVPLGGTLVVARTVAAPGYGHEASEQLAETVGTFAQLPGYCGHLEGVNEAVEEEAWSFVFASNRWDIPLPRDGETTVRLYRRVR